MRSAKCATLCQAIHALSRMVFGDRMVAEDAEEVNRMQNQTAWLTEIEKIEIRDSPMPEVGPDDVLLEIKHVGVCGSDVGFFTDPTAGGHFDTRLPVVLGHECAGKVIETGAKVTGLAAGDLVAVEPGIPCFHCPLCLSGRYNLCQKVNFMACPPWEKAALHRYISHPAAFCFKLPDNMSTVEGALVEPLAVGVHAATRANVAPGDSVIILGSGTIGLMTLLACRSRGVTNITVVDLYDNRLAMAKEAGARGTINSRETDVAEAVSRATGGAGMDFVFETAGNPKTASLTTRLVKAGGKVVMVGNIHGDTPYDFLTMNNKEADILSIFRYRNIFRPTIESIASGMIPVKQMATAFFPFEQVQKAFETALHDRQNQVKVIIEF